MGIQHLFHVIFIWPIILLLRGVGSPFIAFGQLLQWLFYSRRSPITAYGGGNNEIIIHDKITEQAEACFSPNFLKSSGDNLKCRNRHVPSFLRGLKNEVLHGSRPSSPHSADIDSQEVQKELPNGFFAINVPPKSLEGIDSPQLVFQDKIIALKEMKKYKGARFKSFSTEQEAIDYTRCVPETFTSPVKSSFQNEDTAGNSPHPAALEKSNWKAPKVTDLVKLRKSIEVGDYQTVQNMINSNPRFLISCGDTPSILHEGTRYNALHVAAKSNQPEIIKLLIQTIEDPSFFLKLYGQSQDDDSARNLRVRKLLDLYLNTPDKGPCETPLHFACKFGHKNVVEVLMSHELTEPNPKNKFGETPADLICHRIEKPSKEIKEVKKKIAEYLQGRCYVPLYRDEDNIISPTVGTPCSPIFNRDIFSPPFAMSPMQPFSPEAQVLSPKSPHDPQKVVKAFAGPMSPSQANQFRKLWRSPCSRNEQAKVVREDHEKGYERIGRNLASKENIPWSEYWEFLDRYTDLSKPEGIQLLESYLQKQYLALNVQCSLEAIQLPLNHPSTSSKQSSASKRLQSMKNALFGSDDDNDKAKPKNIVDNGGDEDISSGKSSESSSIPSPSTLGAQSPNPDFNSVEKMDVSPPLENGTTTVEQGQTEKKELSFREENLEAIMDTLAKDFGTKLIIVSPESSLAESFTEKPELKDIPEVNANMNCLFSLKDGFTDMLNAVQNQEPLSVSFTPQANCDKQNQSCPSSPVQPVTPTFSKSSTHTGTVLLTVKSPKKLIAQINAMPAKSPPELKTPLKVFIQGPVPTKLDKDVLHCLKNVPVNSKQFPYTAKWLKLINSFTEIEQKSWPSPAKVQMKESSSRDGTPVMKSRTVRRLEPTSLFKSPSTTI